MSLLQDWKDKLAAQLERLTTRDLVTIAGVTGAALAVLVAFKRVAPKPGSSRLHIH